MRTVLLSAIIAVAAAAVDAGAQCPDGTPPPCRSVRPAPAAAARAVPPPAIRARQLMLLPFRNVTRQPAHDWLVTGAPLMLATSLGQFRDLAVVPDEVLAAALRKHRHAPGSVPDASQLRVLANETGGWTAISGNVLAAGPTLSLTAQALDVVTSRVIARTTTDVAADADVRPAFDRLTLELLRGLTGDLPAVDAADLASLTTRSLDAYRAYVRAVDLHHRAQYAHAREALLQAVTLDSTFAMAWAHLALSAFSASGIEALANPFSEAYYASGQAAQLAARLPGREARLIQAQQAFLGGQPGRTLAIADSLVATDPRDLNARMMLAAASLLDYRLDSSGRIPLRSFKAAIQHSRLILDQDPTRQFLYEIPALAYSFGARVWWGDVGSFRRELPSFAAAFASTADATFVPVLRDTFEFVPSHDFNQWPAHEIQRARRRSADAGAEWVSRWVAAAPGNPEAHMWASRFAEVRGEYASALSSLARAESLGVQSQMEHRTGRRLSLLVLAGRLREAKALTDSLRRAGALAQRPLVAALDRRRQGSVVTMLLSKDWEHAAAVAEQLGPPPARSPMCATLARELTGTNAVLPGALLHAVMDTVARHFAAVHAVPSLRRCAESLAAGLVVDSLTSRRTSAGAALLGAADSLAAGGDYLAAFRAARAALTADTAREPSVAARSWFAERALRMAVGRHFLPAPVTVAGDSIIVRFIRHGRAEIEIDAPGLATSWRMTAVLTALRAADTVQFGIRIAHAAPPSDSGRRGGTGEVVAAITSTEAFVPGRPEITADARAHARGDTILVVVRGPLIQQLRTLRPTRAEFRAVPCYGVQDGLCARPTVAVEYRE